VIREEKVLMEKTGIENKMENNVGQMWKCKGSGADAIKKFTTCFGIPYLGV